MSMAVSSSAAPMERDSKAYIANKPPKWAAFHLMPLGCMTCTAMFGNGVWITGMTIMRVRRRMAAPGLTLKPQKTLIACCSAVPGTTVRGIVARRVAAASIPAPATTTSVFEWFVLREDSCIPLPFCALALCPFSLYPSFFSLPSSRFARSFFAEVLLSPYAP